MKKRKKLFIILGVVLILILIFLAVAKKKGWIGNDKGVKVSVEEVILTDIIESVSANGRIQPELSIKITPYISGEVVELTVREGDKVNQGDLLAKIDPEIYVSNYERMLATLNQSKANEANARAQVSQVKAQFVNEELKFKRNKQLFDQSVISAAEFDAAKAAYEMAKAQVTSAEEGLKGSQFQVTSMEAQLKEAKDNLNKTAIYAPSDGTISKLNVEKGERVSGASQFSAGTELMKIANLNSMEAVVFVNENDIVRIHLDDTCLIEVDAYLNRKFKGLVTEIATSADLTGTSTDQVTNFQVKIRLLKSSYQDLLVGKPDNFSPFRPGMSTNVEIQTEIVKDALSVPIQAVTTRSDTTGKSDVKKYDPDKNNESTENKKEAATDIQEYVFLFKEGSAIITKVKTGIQDNTNIQIVEGLKKGDKIITGPYRAVSKTLKNNDKVKEVDKKELFKEEK